jgi:hypothetical protein
MQPKPEASSMPIQTPSSAAGVTETDAGGESVHGVLDSASAVALHELLASGVYKTKIAAIKGALIHERDLRLKRRGWVSLAKARLEGS